MWQCFRKSVPSAKNGGGLGRRRRPITSNAGEGTSTEAARPSEGILPDRSSAPAHASSAGGDGGDGRQSHPTVGDAGEGTSGDAARTSAPAAAPTHTVPDPKPPIADLIEAVFPSRPYEECFEANYMLNETVGRGQYGITYSAMVKRGELEGQTVAVKVIPKAEMTTTLCIDDVRREVKLLKAFSRHTSFVKFHDACEDAHNVYLIMELCEGGELYQRILARNGGYTEEDAKVIVAQILSGVAFCHLQGVVHRDLKPENVLYTTSEENAPVKIIDFGLSKFVAPDERLIDTVGTAFYVAPEVLNKSYNTEADIWSIGVITFLLLCGKVPFEGQTGAEVLNAVLGTYPNFTDPPWPDVSPKAKDFVKRLMKKEYRQRMTAAQALTHPWLHDEQRQVPLDMLIYKLVKSYLRATPVKRAALKALSEALRMCELVYIRSQFQLLKPNKDGCVSFKNFEMALMENSTRDLEASRVPHILSELESLFSDTKMDFKEFCAATISPYQLEGLEDWHDVLETAFMHFKNESNFSVEELAKEQNLDPIRYYIEPNGSLTLAGYTRLFHGVTRYVAQTQDTTNIHLQFVYYLFCIYYLQFVCYLFMCIQLLCRALNVIKLRFSKSVKCVVMISLLFKQQFALLVAG